MAMAIGRTMARIFEALNHPNGYPTKNSMITETERRTPKSRDTISPEMLVLLRGDFQCLNPLRPENRMTINQRDQKTTSLPPADYVS